MNQLKVALSAIVAVCSLAAGCGGSPGGVEIREPWLRATAGETPAAGYFTLENRTGRPLELTGARSAACGMLMIHRSQSQGGMARMDPVTSIDVPKGGRLAFQPGGYHLMCMDPTPAVTPGGWAEVTLEFDGAPPSTARFAVKNAAGG